MPGEKSSTPSDIGVPLRTRAEELLRHGQAPLLGATGEAADALKMLHELQVHHVELQLQNEELEEARLEALAARDRYARLFDLAPVGVITLSSEGRILEANAAAATLLNTSPEALRQRHFDEFLVADSQPVWCDLLAQAAHAETAVQMQGRHPTDLQLKAGNAAPCSVQADMAFDAATQSMLLTLMDVTERDRANRLQQGAVRALEQTVRMKNEFLSRMSHELRTPLNAVLGFSQLQLMDRLSPLAPASRERAEHIERAGQHLLSLIEEAMDIASIESGHLVITIEPMDVAAIVAECLSMAGPQARQAGIALIGAASAGAHGRALAEPRRLRQVLLNLVSNAIKYNRPGGEVRVAWRNDLAPDVVTITVADTGQGMSPEQQQRLFRAFDRLGAESTVVPGSGLGLVITRLLVQAMGGTLKIDSEAGRGTVVHVSLPAAPPAAAATGGASALTPMAAPAAAAARARVLYIEDNAASRTLMAGVVGGIDGASLALAFDGLSGLAQAGELQPDVVIVDLNLPDIDGISVLRALRQRPVNRNCHCVAVSADLTNEVEKRMRAAGFDEFWPKPSSVEFMRERLARLLHAQG